MSDDTSKRNPQDASKINVHESWEVRYWTEKFGITAEKLEEAVKAVGPGVKKVTNRVRHGVCAWPRGVFFFSE